MEDRESKLLSPFGIDEDQRQEEERLITRKRKRKGTPRKLVLSDEIFTITESLHQRPTENFSNQEGLDQNLTGGNFFSDSLIVNAREDIIAKIASFCGNCSCGTYNVSAMGDIAHISILQHGNVLTYEGSYGIVSLTGHVTMSLTAGGSNGDKVLISLTSEDASVFGGYVSSPLIAASDVEIVVWRFTYSPLENASSQGSSSTKDTLIYSSLENAYSQGSSSTRDSLIHSSLKNAFSQNFSSTKDSLETKMKIP